MIISDNKAQKNKKGGRDMRDTDDVAANEVETDKIRTANATETNNLGDTVELIVFKTSNRVSSRLPSIRSVYFVVAKMWAT